jgi:hypothetical protein
MLKKLLIPTAGIVALLALGGVALAGIPCAGTSFFDVYTNSVPCDSVAGGFCPAGDMSIVTVKITVNDCYGNALDSLDVDIRPDTPGFKFTAAESSQVVATNTLGEAQVTVQCFGGCGDLDFIGICEGVTLGPSDPIYSASVDNNGSGAVDAVDFSIFAGNYGSANPCHDYNCSGQVDAVDFSIFAGHYGHVLCP